MATTTHTFHSMKVTELKDLLRRRSLPISGKKADLIERLELSDLSQIELKNQLKKLDLSQSGSVTDLVKRLQSHRIKERGCTNALMLPLEMPKKQRVNPFEDPWPMKCRGCGLVVPNNQQMAHVNKCWFQNGEPNVYLMHAQSQYWGGRFELLMAFPLNGSFKDVDLALRYTWMQCCYGHSSEMDIYPPAEFQNALISCQQPKQVVMLNSSYIQGMGQGSSSQKPMDSLLQMYTVVGSRMFYAFDICDETTIYIRTLGLKCLRRPLFSDLKDFTKGKHILMRNELVSIPCFKCNKPSKVFTQDVHWNSDDVNNNNFGGDAKFFCSKPCGKSFGFHPSELKPFLNSPRSGCCNYKGLNYFE